MAENVSVEFGAETSGAMGGITEVRYALQGLLDPIRGIRQGLGELGEAFIAAFAVDKLIEFTKAMGQLGEDTTSTMKELGLSAKAVTDLNYAAGRVGVSAESMAMSMTRLSRNLSEAEKGTGSAFHAFQTLNPEIVKTYKQTGDLSSILPMLADGFAKYADGPAKVALAMDIGGRAFQRMIPLFDEGSAGWAQMTDAAKAAGVELSDETATALDNTHNKIYDLEQTLAGLKLQGFQAIEPAIDSTTDALTKFAGSASTANFLTDQLHKTIKDLSDTVEELREDIIGWIYIIDSAALAMNAWALSVVDFIIVADKMNGVDVSSFFAGFIADVKESTKELYANIDAMYGLDAATKQTFDDMTELLATETQVAGVVVKPETQPRTPDVSGADAAAKKAFEYKIALLDQEEAAEKNDYNFVVSIERQKLNDIKNMYGERSTEYVKQQTKLEDVERQHQTKMEQVNASRVAAEMALDKVALENKKAILETEYAAGLLTDQQMLDANRTIEDKEYEDDRRAMQAKLFVMGQEPQYYKTILQEMEALKAKHEQKMLQLTLDSVKKQIDAYKQSISVLTRGFDTWIQNVFKGTATFGQLWRGMLSNMVSLFAQQLQKMLERWLLTEALKLAASNDTWLGQLADWLLGDAASKGSSLLQITDAAALAFANAYAATSAIPYIGPELAPGAAASAYAGTMSAVGLLSGAGGIGEVPHDMMAQIHKKEMVLPAALSEGIRNLIKNGGGAQSGGTGPLAVHFNVSAIDSRSVAQFFKTNGSAIVASLGLAQRNAAGNSLFRQAMT